MHIFLMYTNDDKLNGIFFNTGGFVLKRRSERLVIIMAEKKKCPLCGGKVFLEYCEDCGFRIVDESSLGSLYNYEPSDYRTEDSEETVREIQGTAAEEIYPVRSENPVRNIAAAPFTDAFEERDKGGEAYGNNDKIPIDFDKLKNNAKNESIFNENPYKNTEFRENQNSGYDKSGIAGFIRSEWWKLIIIFALNFFGIIAGLFFLNSYKLNINKNPYNSEYIKYMKIAVIISILLNLFRFI